MRSDSIKRDRRLDAIRDLIEREAIGSQTELVERLMARGHEVVQSSISRDLRDLGVVKIDRRYRLREALNDAIEEVEASLTEIAPLLRRVSSAGPNLSVVHTVVGGASRVGLAIDHCGWSEVVGTVAGDDTLFIAVAGNSDQVAVNRRLKKLMERAVQHA